MPTLKVVMAMLLWAACFPLITAGLALAPHLTFAALRAFVAGAALVGTSVALGRPFPSGRNTWLLLIVAGIGATTLGFLGMFHAAEFISPGIATVIANTQPLLAAALAYMVLKERLGIPGMIGLLVGFAGIAVIAAPGLFAGRSNDDYLLGIAYVLLAALGITVSNVSFKRLAGEVDALMAAGAQLLIGMVPLVVLAALTETPSDVEWSPRFILSLLGLSLPGTALVYWLWLSALRTLTLNRANAFSFLVPVFGLSLGIAFYGEALTVSIAVGATLAFLGIILVNRSGRASPSDLHESTFGLALEAPTHPPQPSEAGKSSAQLSRRHCRAAFAGSPSWTDPRYGPDRRCKRSWPLFGRRDRNRLVP